MAKRTTHMSLPPVYSLRMLNARGEYETVLDIVHQMQADGTDPRIIDRWVQGLELGMRLRAHA